MKKNERNILIKFLFSIIYFTFIKCDYYSFELNRSKKSLPMKEQQGLSFLEHCSHQDKKLYHNNLKEINSIDHLLKVASIPITNYFDVQYYGSLFLGSNLQELTVIFDTGSNILWVESKDCVSCRNFTVKYDYNQSSTMTDLNMDKNITYAIGYVSGKYIQDNVYIAKDMGVEGLKFLIIDYEDKLAGTIADGVLGLGVETDGDINNSFIQMLYKQGKIKQPSFSFFLTETKKDSRLYIGDIKENPYLSDIFSHMTYCSVSNHSHYWQCDLNEISLLRKDIGDDLINGVNNTDNKFEETKEEINATFITTSKVIFDTGTSYLIVPALDFLYMIPAITERALDKKCGLTPYFQLICKCLSPKHFDDILLNIGGNNFKIQTENIIEFYPTLEYQCRFELIVDIFMMDAWILGDNVLRYTLLTFDMLEKRIGYIQDINSISDEVVLSTDEDDLNVGTSNNSMKIWYFLGFIFVFTVIFYIVRWVSNINTDSSSEQEHLVKARHSHGHAIERIEH